MLGRWGVTSFDNNQTYEGVIFYNKD